MTKIKCRKCGKVFPFEDIVCPKCGYDITEDEENVPIRDRAYVKQLKNLKREREGVKLGGQDQKTKVQQPEKERILEVKKYNSEEAWEHRNEFHLEKDASGMTRVHIPLSTMLIITVIMLAIIIIAAYLK